MTLKALTFSIIFYLVAAQTSWTFAQQKDSISYEQYQADSMRIAKPRAFRPQVRFDTRATVYEKQQVFIYGYDAGVLVNNKLRLGLGYYRIDDDLPEEQVVKDISTRVKAKIHYGSFNTELVYFNRRFVSFGFPFEIGVGNYRITNSIPDSAVLVSSMKGYMAFTNFGLSGTFKPIRWIGLKGMVGYRKTIYTSSDDFDFNGLYTSIGISIDMQEIIKDIRMFRLMKRYYGKDLRRLPTFVNILAD